MTEKYIGYLLLSIGICIIGFSVVSMYRVFTRQTQPLQVFSLSGITIDANKFVPSSPLLPQQKNAKPALIELFPADMMNSLLNTTAHVIFMGFLVSVGYHIATLGTMLVRPIVVKVTNSSLTNALSHEKPL
ncbi:MAG: hypothetical protein ACD_48C00314G0003 [uncultured bacterium]|uniref:Uncharacterized protein n=1 Tax=Candidatus Roizmanbacteria bacterium RIFCSPLOWO2_01_FULL_45_11 TaxID=1802070 RepID=A0A1F7JHY0_9BACT|nr:MAG: hypothetical protein ACD_48C00314G0003 [uncultured bacterium]OGK55202.1 MAG: hypothetical protein A3B56_03070 [Candidatus Roizmanbacteria bacterium RIFCSPLOWO2_01_FULL_45_11]